MMSHLNRAEMMGATLEEGMKIDIILESLLDSFSQFKMNYNMNKLKLTPTQLMHDLESAGESLVKLASVHLVKGSVKPKRKPKGGNKKKKKVIIPVTKSNAMKKLKGKCFKCGQKGYWKKDCTMVKQKLGMSDLNVIEAYNDKWIIDSGVTNHVCYSLQWFK